MRTNDFGSSCLLRDDKGTLLECIMCCRASGDTIDKEDVDEVQERVVGKVTPEVIDLCQ